MKIANLLAQYLYNNKQLDLPGIGSFYLDPSVSIEPENPRSPKSPELQGVSFVYNNALTDSTELVKYISSETGKMKALAAADLDSHLSLALQFINIGKPFLFEGIGSLSKQQSGGFLYTPGTIINARSRENVSASHSEEPVKDYPTVYKQHSRQFSSRTTLIALLVIAGLGLAVWGGYMVYQRTTDKPETIANVETPEVTNLVMQDTVSQRRDSAMPMPETDQSITTASQVISVPAGNYKFVVETANKDRGLKRYSTLKGYGIDIQLDSADTANYKLYFVLPAAAPDTTRVLDSLRIIYTPAGKSAHIEPSIAYH